MTQLKDEMPSLKAKVSDPYEIPEEYFETPTMGDFYLGAVDTKYLDMLDAMIDEPKGKDGKKADYGNGRNAAFYTEDLKVRDEGEQPDGSIFLGVTPELDEQIIDSGWMSATRLVFKASSLKNAPHNDKSADKIKSSKFSQKNPYGPITEDDYFFFNLYGAAGPQPPMWCYEQGVSTKNFKIDQMTPKELQAAGGFTSGVHDTSSNTKETISVLTLAANKKGEATPAGEFFRPRECTVMKNDEATKTMDLRWYYTEGEGTNTAEALKSSRRIAKIIKDSDDGKVYLHIDVTASETNAAHTGIDFNTVSAEKVYGEMAGDNKHGKMNAYCLNRTDSIGNLNGEAFIKKDGKWINLAKVALTEDGGLYTPVDNIASKNDNFKKNYDIKEQNFADAYFALNEKLDDRKEIQKKIFNKDWNELRKWTVTIGDVTFFVPPEQIAVESATQTENWGMLRAHGTMAKGSKNVARSITMALYFNGDKGINGIKHEVKSPSGDRFIYSMNGLRALLSEFRFTPFLPIENDYINDVLNIEACMLDSIEISSVPGFPKLMRATLTIREFNYLVYMPQVNSLMSDSFAIKNLYASTINWQTMRYYYQRPLIAGDKIQEHHFALNSQEYLNESMLYRTAFQPMLFRDSTLKIYAANLDYLDKMLEMMEGNGKSTASLDAEGKKFVGNLGAQYGEGFHNAMESKEFKEALKKLNDVTLLRESDNKNYGIVLHMDDADFHDEPSQYINKNKTKVSGGIVGKPLTDTGLRKADIEKELNNVIGVLKEHLDVPPTKYGKDTLDFKNAVIHYNQQSCGDDTIKLFAALDIPIPKNLYENGELSTISDEELEKLRQNVAREINVDKNLLLKNDFVRIPLCIRLKPLSKDSKEYVPATNSGWMLDTAAPDVKFLEYCFQNKSDPTNKAKQQASPEAEDPDTQNKWRTSKNMDALQNMQFDLVDAGTILIESWNASVSNTFTAHHTSDYDGLAPQYLGGGDMTLSMNITTKNQKVVNLLQSLPQLEALYIRKYRRVIPHAPVRVDSEITRFLGITDVMIENVVVNTVPGYPGLYKIQMSMRAIDRTIRQKESLKMLEAENAGDLYDHVGSHVGFNKETIKEFEKKAKDFVFAEHKYEGAEDYIPFVRPLKTALDFMIPRAEQNRYGERQLKSYFDISAQLDKAELYPDLELPTVQEMEDLGWEFVRYKFQVNRRYVDPDFYFIYLESTIGEVNREIIVNSVDQGFDGGLTMKDGTGAEVEIVPAKSNGYKVKKRNDVAQRQNDKVKAARDAQKHLNEKQTKENLHKDKNSVLTEDFEGWDINNDIKAMFMEERYKKEYDAFCAAERADGNNPETSSASNVADTETNKEISDDNAQKQNNTPPEVKRSEGKWVHLALDRARQASERITTYLETTPIEVEVKAESEVYAYATGKKSVETKSSSGEKKKNLEFYSAAAKAEKTDVDFKKAQNMITAEIEAGVTEFFSQPEILSILQLIDVDVTGASAQELLAIIKDIIYSAACAASGDKEYSNKEMATNWRPNPKFLGYIKKQGGAQDKSMPTTANFSEEAVMYASIFGCFKIQQYSSEELLQLTGYGGIRPEGWGDSDSLNTNSWLLDAYYRYKPEATIEEYKRGCINSPKYCTHAFCRNVLFWLRRLIDMQAIPSINADVLRKAGINEISIQKTIEANDANDKMATASTNILKNHIGFFQKNGYCVDAGKIWTACALTLTNGSDILLKRIEERDYRGLNEYIHGRQVPKLKVDKKDKIGLAMRKMSLALIGRGRIKDVDVTGVLQNSAGIQEARNTASKKYIEAAEDPSKFMIHSCHDMITHDARGRMLRAFPTFYLLFIDEGRDIGTFHLHDNFYNIMSVMEFTISKSRKNPADTAEIIMSNMFQTLQTEQEPYTAGNEASGWDVFRSVFVPNLSDYAKEQEGIRKQKSVENRLRLRAGARVHIRMGYGSNVSFLPPVFNGVIAEVGEDMEGCQNGSSSTISIVAQGDGVELMNPIADDDEAHRVQNAKTWTNNLLSNGETPKNIMTGILTTDGGSIKHFMKLVGKADLLGANPYGISHFGTKDFNSIVPDGEVVQNIFEAWGTPSWSGGRNDGAAEGAPHITFELFGKTVWEVANICKSVMPDFICGIAPFGFRSTLFIGAPRYYYAYDYMQVNGAIHEKRKPYQQYHIYTSSTDIIGDGIVATARDMKTAAVGLYTKCHTGNTKEQHRVGPLFVDIDIYPEFQKTMVVDTKYLGKGPTGVGMVTNFFTSFECIDNLFDDQGSVVSDKKMAWRMTASALKDSVKDMYAGDLIVYGDPTVKPHDRIFVADYYEGITGQCTVKEVVHHMSVDGGFTTAVTPDCINVVDDNYEPIVHHWFSGVSVFSASHIASLAIIAYLARFNNAADILGAINKIKGSAVSQLEKMGGTKWIDSAKKVAKDVAVNGTKAELFGGATAVMSKVLPEAATKIAGKVASSAAGKFVGGALMAVGGAALGTLGIGAAIATAPAWATVLVSALICEVISANLTNFLDDFTKNRQVVTIYPLLKHGRTWTAGLGGSKGLIYGSPSFKEKSFIDHIQGKIIAKSTDGSIGGQVANFVRNIFFTEDQMKAAARYAEQQGAIDDDGNPTCSEASFEKNLRSAVGGAGQAGDAVLKNDYRRLQLQPRVDYAKHDDFMISYNHFALLDTEKYMNDPKFQLIRMVSEDARFRPYIDEDFFRIIHEDPGLNQGKDVDTKILKVNGVEQYVKIIQNFNNDGTQILDMPLLNPEAINILYELVRRAKNYMPSANSSDPNETYELTKGSYVILESALRVGDRESMGATGYTFIVRGVDKAAQPLANAIKELNDEITSDAEKNSLCEVRIFDSKDIGENRTSVVVRMPVISAVDADLYRGSEGEKENSNEDDNFIKDPFAKNNKIKGAVSTPTEVRQGTMFEVHDGDTAKFKDAETGSVIDVRFACVDSPEASDNVGYQPYGEEAGDFVRNLIEGKQVTLYCYGTEGYGRMIGRIVLEDGTDINGEIIKAGYAWHNKEYDNTELYDTYAKYQQEAQRNKLGMWADPNNPPEKPNDFRHRKKTDEEKFKYKRSNNPYSADY